MLTMVHKIFKGIMTIFLPIIENSKMSKNFSTRGGERQWVLSEETTHIVAQSWDEVKEHLAEHMRLLPYFLEQCYIVDKKWVFFGVEANRLQLERP